MPESVLDDASAVPDHAKPSWGRALRVCITWIALWWAPVVLVGFWLGGDHTLFREGLFFSAAAMVTIGDADDVFFDPNRHLVYVIGGEGAVDIVRVRDRRHYEPAGRTRTAAGARTGLFVPGLDRLFVAVPHQGSQASKVLVYRPAQFP